MKCVNTQKFQTLNKKLKSAQEYGRFFCLCSQKNGKDYMGENHEK